LADTDDIPSAVVMGRAVAALPGGGNLSRFAEERGLIRCSGGHLEILDEPGLAKVSRECPQVVRRHFGELEREAEANAD
jgi:hypothetical protein